MPAKSKKQQRFFGLVKSIQEGKAEGSAKAKEVAESMPEESVSHYASTPSKDLPEKKAVLNDADVKYLLGVGGLSALLGAGLAGGYGATKLVHDASSLAENRLSKFEKRIKIPGTHKKLDENKDRSQEMLSDADRPQLSELDDDSARRMLEGDDGVKASEEKTWTESIVGPVAAGAALPLAAVVPGVATYMLGRRLVDKIRRDRLDQELEQAKSDFERILSKTSSSDLQRQVDELGEKYSYDAEAFAKSRELPPPPTESRHSPTSGVYDSLAYVIAGLPAGVGAILGWNLMQERMAADPERQKLKELQSLLRRDIASRVVSGGIDLEEGEGGRPQFKL